QACNGALRRRVQAGKVVCSQNVSGWQLSPTMASEKSSPVPGPLDTPTQPDASTTSSSTVGMPEVTVSSARWAISLSIILGSLTNSVMMGSVNVAVPAMMTHLQADVTQIQWVLTSFMIARTIVMPTLGWIGGRLGNRRLYLTSLSLYMLASMLCGLAWDLKSLIFFRVLQALSAGYLFPLAMTILHEVHPPGQRGMAMGIFMAGMSFGPAIGPSLGGYLVDHLS